jgi:Heparinase II/III-like protein/Heparinase II/III N-terminus
MAAQKLERLRQMGLAEIAGRTRQEAWRWWDRVVASERRSTPPLGLADGGARLRAFHHDSSATRFFSGAADARTPALLSQRVPEAIPPLIAAAEQTLAGRFDLLGYRGLSFGDPIDWHLDAVSKRRAPVVHGSRLDLLDTASVGDGKVVWELNRHQWMVQLAQAYRLTGDERYATAFGGYVRAWLDANPVGWGINWTSSLEVALRLMAWTWALSLLRRSPALTPELFAWMSTSVRDHAAHVERYLSHYSSPNTHLTGEALGLFYAGTMFPEITAARRWRERGSAILVRELDRQILRDGVYFEQSTCYQRYTAEIALHFLILSARNGGAVPTATVGRVQDMLDFLLTVRLPRGDAPRIGDSDGGWLLPLARRSADDLRGIFGVAAAVFGRPDYAWAAGGAVPELLWLLGPDGLADFDSLRPAAPAASRASRLFPEGGYAVMRSGWEPDGHQLIFDVGPLAGFGTGGHGHADLLSVQCAAFGEPFLADAGTGSYADAAWRRFFRGTAAHSTVSVDGEDQALPAGRFAWEQRPGARLRRWVSTEAFDFADAEHDAYGRLADPVRHRRRVLFVKPRYWVIVDDLEGAERHAVELRFQFGPVDVALGPDSWTRATAGGRGLLVRPFATAPLQASLRRGSDQPMEGWVSADYGHRQPAPVAVYTTAARLPVRLVTLLLPSPDPAAAPPAVRPLVWEGGLVGIAFDGDREIVLENESGMLAVTARPEDR